MTTQFLHLQQQLDVQSSWLKHVRGEFNRVGSPDFDPLKEIMDFDAYATPNDFAAVVLDNKRSDTISYQMQIIDTMIGKLHFTLALIDFQGRLALADPRDSALAQTLENDQDAFSYLFAEALEAKMAIDRLNGFEPGADIELSHAFGRISDHAASIYHAPDASDIPDDVLEMIFEARYGFAERHIEDMTIRSGKVWANLQEIVYIKKSVDEAIVPDNEFVQNEINLRFAESAALLQNLTHAQGRAETFKSGLQEMGTDNFSRKDFEVTRYVPLSVNLLCQNSP